MTRLWLPAIAVPLLFAACTAIAPPTTTTAVCDGSALTACGQVCADVTSAHGNCGSCGTACPSGQVCSNGVCSVSCQAGLTDCSGICANLMSDNGHCGACGTICPAGHVCSNGACALSCQTALTNCTGTCANLQ